MQSYNFNLGQFVDKLVFCQMLMLARSLVALGITVGGFAKKRISELKTVNIAQNMMRGRMFN